MTLEQSKSIIYKTMDGNEASSYVAYKTNEVCIIYPITPSSQMGEFSDQWSADGVKNIYGTIPQVTEMQSEAGASGAIHGAVQTGSLTTTFTASQGLLLMIPNMYRIAGELSPTVFHVASRAVASQGMTIYCEHSDVMAVRQTGFALLCSANVQEAHDMALIAQTVSLQSKIPFLHFFDGFRTSHEVAKIGLLTDEQMQELINLDDVLDLRQRKLSPNDPCVRGTIFNSDIYFQTREVSNKYYNELPKIMEQTMQKFKHVTGREYGLVEYYGDKNAESIIVLMGSGAETVIETVEYLNAQNNVNVKVGVIKVHLFRPFPKKQFIELIPSNCKAIAVLDRTKEAGSAGEPLYEEIATTILEAYCQGKLHLNNMPKVIGGRYGIAGKEFTPAMVKAIFTELSKSQPRTNFTVGIKDDVTFTSLDYDNDFNIESSEVIRAVFYGLGADGTVGANKNTIKIIGEETDLHVQAFFEYDSKKSGSKTVSHLRFGPKNIRSSYLITSANFVACHQFGFVEKMDVLERASNNAIFLLNSIYSADTVWNHLPCSLQETIIKKNIKFYVIDAYKVAQETGMGGRINTIMQTCFFALSNVLPKDEAIRKIKESIKKTYASKGENVVKKNYEAVDQTLANLYEVTVQKSVTSTCHIAQVVPNHAPEFVKEINAKMIAGIGDELPVSKIPFDGSFPTNTTCWEKRNIALQTPEWLPQACLQCGQCSIVCPHSVIRVKRFDSALLEQAPSTFKSIALKAKGYPDTSFTLQVYYEDCTGCGLCVQACPVNRGTDKKRAINLATKPEDLNIVRQEIAFFEQLPENLPETQEQTTVRGLQYLPPMIEFCGACAGCGETPYIKIITQLFGDRMLIANACGCSSVYGGQQPTSPWRIDKHGRGPAWSSSLFEDNAEFGFGFALTVAKHQEFACELLQRLSSLIGDDLVKELLSAEQEDIVAINTQRERVKILKDKLQQHKNNQDVKQLLSLADYLVKHSVWSFGGDGWAYDIGYSGLDHVLASGKNINLLVLDTEVYSNTGGQSSKSTPRGAVAKFASSGKGTSKKDLGLIMMTYGSVYVASIAIGANPTQAIKAIKEAENYNGPSLILAYSHCIAHGIDMKNGLEQQKLAVKSGHWPLYRYNPDRVAESLNPFQLDSEQPSIPFKDYAYNENRYQTLLRSQPDRAEMLLKQAEQDIKRRWQQYLALASQNIDKDV